MIDDTATPASIALRALLAARHVEFNGLLAKYGATNPLLFGSVARGTAHPDSDIDILVEMDPADGNLLMRASGLLEETRALLGTEAVDIFPVQLLKEPVAQAALEEAVAL
ncbi:nucleotidyltransferase domain-containing protein [Actinomyces sp. B33]|uniref:nucleotidyltransferase family protein n=1 Tax=Actinomyces sp. B33 TaxID=2942131 RepID=UPI002340873B|nr:nucleotidyltransferase domain-containing protein [Actinomyces sp. B33]MDC4232279.1 nucleotidyltransferase domain-containing protein [Actinomyces sp. B33]